MRTSYILLLVTVLGGVSLLLQTTVTAQTSYITVYGQLAYSRCTSTIPSCQSFFYLVTNGTTPGIPPYPTLDFSQSLVPAPAQSDVGKTISAIGYYGSGSKYPVANGYFAFFVHLWGPYFGSSTIPTKTGCFTSSNPPSTWYSAQCVTAPTIPLVGTGGMGSASPSPLNPLSLTELASIAIIVIVVAYIFTHRKK